MSPFYEIFTSSNASAIEEVCEVVHGKLTNDHYARCEERSMEGDVDMDLFQMHPMKSPKPDGLRGLFYQRFWHIVKHDIFIWVLGELNDGDDT